MYRKIKSINGQAGSVDKVTFSNEVPSSSCFSSSSNSNGINISPVQDDYCDNAHETAVQAETFQGERLKGSTNEDMMDTKKHYKDCFSEIFLEYASVPKRRNSAR